MKLFFAQMTARAIRAFGQGIHCLAVELDGASMKMKYVQSQMALKVSRIPEALFRFCSGSGRQLDDRACATHGGFRINTGFP